MSARPIDDRLYTGTADAPQLVGSRCDACGEVTFPKQESCPACASTRVQEIPLSRRGTLWTWTVQSFPPPSPPFAGDAENFVPFGVGYIELPEGIRVEARLTENDASRLEIGMEMELVLEKFGEDEDGTDVMTFAFQPV